MNIDEIIEKSLQEDIGSSDITSEGLDIRDKDAKASIIAKNCGVICGLEIAKQVFLKVDKSLDVTMEKEDSDSVERGDIVLVVQGNAVSILKAERVALNFLQRLSGISTETSKYSSNLRHAKVYDTRKTTPLLRELEKYAVKMGGGKNHRFGLSDQILIKENHISLAGGISKALLTLKNKYPNKLIEIEVSNFYEFMEAIQYQPEIILLDNMNPKQVKDCINVEKNYNPQIEVSGNISLDTFKKYDIPGVDRISVGSLTHSVKSLDLSLIFDE